jgi:hypothetical protein
MTIPGDSSPKDELRFVPQAITEIDLVPLTYKGGDYQVSIRYQESGGKQTVLPAFSIEKDTLILTTGGISHPIEFTPAGDLSFASYAGTSQPLRLDLSLITWTAFMDGISGIKQKIGVGNFQVAASMGDPVPELVLRSTTGTLVVSTGTATKADGYPTYDVSFDLTPATVQRLAASPNGVSLRLTTRHEGYLVQKQLEIAASAVQNSILEKYRVVQTIPSAVPGYVVSLGVGGSGNTYDALSDDRLSGLGLTVTFYDNVQSSDSTLAIEILKQALQTRDKWMTDDTARVTFLFGEKLYLSGLIGDVKDVVSKYVKTDRNTKDELIQADKQDDKYTFGGKASLQIGSIGTISPEGNTTSDSETSRQRTQVETIDLLNELKDDLTQSGKTLTALRFDESGKLTGLSAAAFNANMANAVASKIFEWNLLQSVPLRKSSIQMSMGAPPARATFPVVWTSPADIEVGRGESLRPEDVELAQHGIFLNPFVNLPPGKRVVVSGQGKLHPRSGSTLWVIIFLQVNGANQGDYIDNSHSDNKSPPVHAQATSGPVEVPADGQLKIGLWIELSQTENAFSVPVTFERGFSIIIDEPSE